MNGGGLHHLHTRTRGRVDVEPFPARTPLRRLLDRTMFVIAFLVPVALLPQVFQIFINKSASVLSIYTWVALSVANSLWALYGFVHKDKPILIANILITFLNITVVIGILKYGS